MLMLLQQNLGFAWSRAATSTATATAVAGAVYYVMYRRRRDG